jgi:UDP-N-acetylmuramoyl-L-alanyl-D-glutamate--2,6-diaminopimelate ligase
LAFVDYAHTPAALLAVLEACRDIALKTCGRLIVVAGCGGGRDTEKRSVMGQVCADNADLFIATSDNPRDEEPELILDEMLRDVAPGSRHRLRREPDRRKAIELAADHASAGDVLLVAGKGHEIYQVVGSENHEFDDHDELARALGSSWVTPERVAGVRVGAR